MSLLVLGHRPIYADDLDELLLLAREREQPVGALLLPAACALDWWPVVRKRVVEPLGLAPRSVLPVGARLPDAEAEALHCDGLRWALWEPFSPLELRFAVTLALSESDLFEFRIDTRVPCSIGVEVEAQSRIVPAHLTDLSACGAFVQLAHPHPERTPLVVRLELCGRVVSLRAHVAWRSGTRSPAWRDRGMGIEFEDVDPEALTLLREQAEHALDRFRLGAPAMAQRPPEGSA